MSFHSIEATPEMVLAEAGGKSSNLARVTHHGLAVPEWFAISAAAFHAFVKEHHLENLLAQAVPTAEFAGMNYRSQSNLVPVVGAISRK